MNREAARLVACLREKNLSLSTAESCTGGAIASAVVSVPGASAVFAGGIVCYQTRLKEQLLGVSPALIGEKSVVSAEVAEAMSRGCAAALGTDCAVSVTGLAGPASPDDPAPVGTVYIGVTTPDGTTAKHYLFAGDRAAVRRAAVRAALRQLTETLQKK